MTEVKEVFHKLKKQKRCDTTNQNVTSHWFLPVPAVNKKCAEKSLEKKDVSPPTMSRSLSSKQSSQSKIVRRRSSIPRRFSVISLGKNYESLQMEI